MAPCPDPKGFPRPKLSLELAFAMLRQLFCGRCFLCHACYACLSACQRVVEQGFPDGVACPQGRCHTRPVRTALVTAPSQTGHAYRNPPASVALAGVPQPESRCCISVPVCLGGAVFFPFSFASLLRLRGPPWPLRTSPFFSDRALGSTGGTVTAWPVRGLTGTGFGGRHAFVGSRAIRLL